jgi:hypothetical protein
MQPFFSTLVLQHTTTYLSIFPKTGRFYHHGVQRPPFRGSETNVGFAVFGKTVTLVLETEGAGSEQTAVTEF